MSETPVGPGWWQATDGRWYPPEAHPQALTPPPPPGSATGGGRRRLWIGIAVVLVSAILGAAGALVIVTRDDDPGPTIAKDPVTAEPATSPGEAPFSQAANVGMAFELSSAAEEAADAINQDLEVDEDTGAREAMGSTPGLYGGSSDAQVCDPFALIEFLENNPAEAAAWAGVFGIRPPDIAGYVGSLTPVLLTADTWVTNHGFEDGEAVPFQSVLQAGTAVLIDDRGLPRVRCACGNPLLEAETPDVSLEATEGEVWDDYQPDEVRVVAPGDTTLEVATLIDTESGEQFDRGLGPGQTGAVQATLRWTGDADMDLHLVDTAGEEIYYGAPTSSTGGELDLDKIPGCGAADTGPHTENIFWDEQAPPGEYTVFVVDYSGCDVVTDFALQVVVGGSTVVSESGSLVDDESSASYTFTVY